MRLLVTCLYGKLDEVYFGFKKIEDVILIYKITRESSDERFQSVYAEAARLTNLVLKRNNHVFVESR